MGAQQSTRKLTLDNDDPANVIKVSDAVVDRLRGTTTEARNQGASTSASSRPPPPPQATSMPPSPPVGVPTSSPLFPHAQFISHGSHQPQSSLQLRQDKEAALQRNDQYWQKRINDLEESHSNINKIMEKEYNDAVQEVNDGFKKPKSHSRGPVCVDNRKAVMKCYRRYPREPMRCAKQVQAFAECVDKHRTDLVANRG